MSEVSVVVQKKRHGIGNNRLCACSSWHIIFQHDIRTFSVCRDCCLNDTGGCK